MNRSRTDPSRTFLGQPFATVVGLALIGGSLRGAVGGVGISFAETARVARHLLAQAHASNCAAVAQTEPRTEGLVPTLDPTHRCRIQPTSDIAVREFVSTGIGPAEELSLSSYAMIHAPTAIGTNLE